MEKRGRKREDKVRTIIAMSPELIQRIKDLANESGKNVNGGTDTSAKRCVSVCHRHLLTSSRARH